MNRGGIFTGPTALGIAEQGVFQNAAMSGVPVANCVFATSYVSDGAKAVQTAMVVMGATKIKVDGLWGPCSESAFQKLAGEPLSAAAIEKKFGITCGKFTKLGTFDPAKCTNGTDAVVTTPVTAPPEYTTPPTYSPPKTGSIVNPVIGVEKKVPITVVGPVSPGQPTTPPTYTPPAAVDTQWISGVPNWGVVAGGALLVVGSVATYFLVRKPKTATANRRRRRSHR